MSTSKENWRNSKDPAYGDGECCSINLNYKYSAEDCSVKPEKKYRLNNVKLIDFWGEGYIKAGKNFITGFKDAYNINHQYQLVSNGPNKGRKIPNRIPVAEYEKYDLKPYIHDSTVLYVTLMGAPLSDETFKEISRILRKGEGVFIFFSDDSEKELLSERNRAMSIFKERDFIFLDKNVYKRVDSNLDYHHISMGIGFVYMAADKILQYITNNTIDFSDRELADLLYNFYCHEATGHWEKALDHLMHDKSDGELLSVLNVLCKDIKHYDCVSHFWDYMNKNTNIFYYMQRVNSEEAEYQYLLTFFRERESTIIKVLFDGKYATITNLEFDMPLKLPKKMVDKDKDKPVFGGSRNRGVEQEEKERFWWRIKPIEITKKETIISIFNVQFGMPLKLPKKMLDRDEDKLAYGGNAKRGIEDESKKRFYWKLEKIRYYNTDFYTLTNLEYDMPLKLPVEMVDKDDDKPAYGGSALRKIECNQQRRFYWCIQAVEDYV